MSSEVATIENNTGLKIEIKITDGKWLVNGKTIKECNAIELDFINRFFAEFKHFATKIDA